MLQRLSSGETRIIVPAKDLSLINFIGMTSSIKHPSSNQLHSSATATVMRAVVMDPTHNQSSSALLTKAQQMRWIATLRWVLCTHPAAVH